MRLGWTKNKSSTTYRVVKTIRVNKKNKTLPRNQIGTGLMALLRAKEPVIPVPVVPFHPRPCGSLPVVS